MEQFNNCTIYNKIMRYRMLFVMLFVFFIPTAVRAQEVQLGITPLKYSLIAKPGTSISLPFTLTNYADATLVTHKIVRVEKTDSLGNYTLLPLEETDQHPQFSLEELSGEPFLLLAKEKFTSLVTLTVPSETKESDYYYALVLQTQHSQGFETTSSIQMSGGIALPVFITVSKTGSIKYKISQPHIYLDDTFHLPFVSKDIFFLDSRHTIKGEIIIENTGNNMADITPFLLFGNKKVPLAQGTILAHSRKNFKFTHTPTPLFGKHMLKISNGNSQLSQTTQLRLITFPFTYFLILLTILVISLFSYTVHKRYTNT